MNREYEFVSRAVFRLVGIGLLLPTLALAQEPRPVQVTPRRALQSPDCREPMNVPRLKFGLIPSEICPNDEVILRWVVTDQRGRDWPHPIQIESPFPLELPDPVPAVGRHTFRAALPNLPGTFTLTTRCGRISVDYDVLGKPHISSVSVTAGPAGAPVRVRGHHFSNEQGSSRVNLLAPKTALAMDVDRWSEDLIDVRVPKSAPVGEAELVVTRGHGCLVSNPRSFTVTHCPVPEQPRGYGLRAGSMPFCVEACTILGGVRVREAEGPRLLSLYSDVLWKNSAVLVGRERRPLPEMAKVVYAKLQHAEAFMPGSVYAWNHEQATVTRALAILFGDWEEELSRAEGRPTRRRTALREELRCSSRLLDALGRGIQQMARDPENIEAIREVARDIQNQAKQAPAIFVFPSPETIWFLIGKGIFDAARGALGRSRGGHEDIDVHLSRAPGVELSPWDVETYAFAIAQAYRRERRRGR